MNLIRKIWHRPSLLAKRSADVTSSDQGSAAIYREPSKEDVASIQRVREEVGRRYLAGSGVEVGAGSRIYPVPNTVRVTYGDIRDRTSLETYFKTDKVTSEATIDAQTFAGIETASYDFVICAHVIEHLRDPLGSIGNALRVIKDGGVHILVVPDMRYTFDKMRPETTLEHALEDLRDGGEASCRQAYLEHLRYVHPYLTGQHHPESEIEHQASECVKRWQEFDIHFHAWTQAGFQALLEAAQEIFPFDLEESVHVAFENIFVLRKRRG